LVRENREEVNQSKRNVMEMNIEGKIGKGRPKKRWMDAIGCDMSNAGMCLDDVGDRFK